MAVHLCAYTALLGTTANTDIAALTDQVLTIQNNHFLPPDDVRLAAAYVGSATLSRARLQSPKIRMLPQAYLYPIAQSTLTPNNPNIYYRRDAQLLIKALEELALEATSGIAMGTERFTGLLWLMKQYDPIPPGDRFAVRFQSTTAAVANAWSDLAITLEGQLPAGRYTMVNSVVQSTNALAHRWFFDGQTYRPGNLSITSLGNRQPYEVIEGLLGAYGTFLNTNVPRLQVLANAADAAHDGFMELVKVG